MIQADSAWLAVAPMGMLAANCCGIARHQRKVTLRRARPQQAVQDRARR